MGALHHTRHCASLDSRYSRSYRLSGKRYLGHSSCKSPLHIHEDIADLQLWWSIWLTVLWVGFWASTAVFMILPHFWRNTIGSIIPSAKKYEDVVRNLGRYAKLVVWMLAVWIAFQTLIIGRYQGDQAAVSRNNLTTFANILFALFICTIVLSLEKLVVQLIAFQFHQDSYEDRLKEQKFNLKTLVTLYINSHDIPGRSDTFVDSASSKTKGTKLPKVAIRKALKGLRSAAATTTT